MILNCPSCSAKFMVSAEAFGDQGRTVRCGKCGHDWFQEAPRDSLDDLQKLVDNIQQEEKIEEVARGRGGNARTAGADDDSTVPHSEIKLEKSLREHAKDAKAKTRKKISFALLQKYEREVAAFLSALAVVSVIVWLIVAITHAAFAPKPSNLMLDQIIFEVKDETLDGSFRVINMSSKVETVPSFKVFLIADNGRIVSSQNVEAEHNEIKGEESIAIPFTFRAPPSVATSVKVTSVP